MFLSQYEDQEMLTPEQDMKNAISLRDHSPGVLGKFNDQKRDAVSSDPEDL